jgi:uncharacterized iron-regulated membrane protein
MTIAPGSSTVKRALSAHAAIGLIAGALLYIVSLSGTIAVFSEEWQRIEQPAAPEMSSISHQAVQRGIEAVIASETGKPKTTHLYVHLPVEGVPRTVITTDTQAVLLDKSGAVAGKEEIAWSDFVAQLHYMLNIPGFFGFILVGILGVMMLTLSLSGIIAHPRIFRDAFRLRARDKGGLGLADWHNRMSVWTLPFILAISLTGALIGTASLTAYGIGVTTYKGHTEAVYEPIFGAEGKPDKTAAPVPNVVAALDYMARHYPGQRLTYVTLHDPMTAGQHIQIVGTFQRRLIFGEYYNFDSQGRFIGTAGISDGPAGQQMAASNYNLHFGNFGGIPVKIAYFILGMALTAICATGTYIWLGKRERRGIQEPRIRALWDAVVWGSPLILALTFLLRKALGNDIPLVAIFWIGLAVMLVASWFVAAPGRLGKLLKRSLVLALGLGSVLALAGL